MTQTERLMLNFNQTAPACRQHGERPKIDYDGTWFVECGKGCSMHDGDNATITPIMVRWVEETR